MNSNDSLLLPGLKLAVLELQVAVTSCELRGAAAAEEGAPHPDWATPTRVPSHLSTNTTECSESWSK